MFFFFLLPIPERTEPHARLFVRHLIGNTDQPLGLICEGWGTLFTIMIVIIIKLVRSVLATMKAPQVMFLYLISLMTEAGISKSDYVAWLMWLLLRSASKNSLAIKLAPFLLWHLLLIPWIKFPETLFWTLMSGLRTERISEYKSFLKLVTLFCFVNCRDRRSKEALNWNQSLFIKGSAKAINSLLVMNSLRALP